MATRVRGTLTAPLLAGLLGPIPPAGVDCPISASAAYNYAMQRGHTRSCWVYPYANATHNDDEKCGINPLPSGEISFFGRVPPSRYDVTGAVFKYLKNGWEVKSYAVSGAVNVTRYGFDEPFPPKDRLNWTPTGPAIHFKAQPSYPSTRAFFDVRLRSLVLTNAKGSCSNVIAEAFGD